MLNLVVTKSVIEALSIPIQTSHFLNFFVICMKEKLLLERKVSITWKSEMAKAVENTIKSFLGKNFTTPYFCSIQFDSTVSQLWYQRVRGSSTSGSHFGISYGRIQTFDLSVVGKRWIKSSVLLEIFGGAWSLWFFFWVDVLCSVFWMHKKCSGIWLALNALNPCWRKIVFLFILGNSILWTQLFLFLFPISHANCRFKICLISILVNFFNTWLLWADPLRPGWGRQWLLFLMIYGGLKVTKVLYRLNTSHFSHIILNNIIMPI